MYESKESFDFEFLLLSPRIRLTIDRLYFRLFRGDSFAVDAASLSDPSVFCCRSNRQTFPGRVSCRVGATGAALAVEVVFR